MPSLRRLSVVLALALSAPLSAHAIEFSAQELARAKTRLIADSIFSQDSQASMARMYGAALVCGSTVADLQDWTNRVRKVTAADVHAVAGRALDLDRAVTAELVRQDNG